MRLTILLLFTACTSSTADVSLEQACSEGQLAQSGFIPAPTSLLDHWNALQLLSGEYVAVVARQRTTPRLTEPMIPTGLGEPVFVECIETAEYQVLDGLGWVEGDLTVTGFTGQGYWADLDGQRVETDLVRADFFFEEYLGLADGEASELLVLLILPDGTHLLRWRAAIDADGLVSGSNTVSGERSSPEAFRR